MVEDRVVTSLYFEKIDAGTAAAAARYFLWLLVAAFVVYSFRAHDGDMLAIAMILASCIVLLYFGRDHPKRETVVLGGLIALYTAVAWFNSFRGSLPGTMPDSWTFHMLAIDMVHDGQFSVGVDYVFYANILAALYFLSSGSFFLASAASVLVMTGSLVVTSKLARELEMSRYTMWLLLLCGLMPAFVMIGPSAMREPWQVLFLSLTLLYGTRAVTTQNVSAIVLLMAVSIVFGLFHKAMLFVAVVNVGIYIVVMLTAGAAKVSRTKLALSGMALAALVGIVVFVIYDTAAGVSLVGGLLKKDPLWTIWYYRTSVDNIGDPNTAYNIAFDHSSIPGGIVSIIKVYVYYLFYPLAISNFGDLKNIYAVMEVWGRIAGLAIVVWGFSWSRWRKKKSVIAAALVYLVLTLTWSLGTTNYGQATRHHILDNWVLVVLVIEAVSSARRRIEHAVSHTNVALE